MKSNEREDDGKDDYYGTKNTVSLIMHAFGI